jgi:hypothetical protein
MGAFFCSAISVHLDHPVLGHLLLLLSVECEIRKFRQFQPDSG